MSIVYAAVVPHAPLLVPTIAKDHHGALKQTLAQLDLVAQNIHAAKPDGLVILTPHGPSIEGCFVVHTADQLSGGLTEFGDVATKVERRGDVRSAHRLKEAAQDRDIPLQLQTYDELDYGIVVPLTVMADATATLPILPIGCSTVNGENLLRFGALLHDFLQAQPQRYAVLASADFTRRGKSGGSGTRATAEERKISAALTSVNASDLTDVQPSAATCGLAPAMALVATLQHLRAKGEILSFEAPFGVGLITATFTFGQ